MDLDDDEQEQAAAAKRKLKRRSKKKSAKAKNAAGAAPHAPVSAPPAAARRRAARALDDDRAAATQPEQERNAFLERIQAEEVRREQARIAAARPVPPPPNRATGGDDSDEGWEESDEDDPVEDLIHRERIRERDLLRTPGCLALGRKAFRLRTCRATERDRDPAALLYILREAERRLQRLFPNHNFRLSWSVRFNVVVQTIDAIALDSNLELTRVDMEVRRSTVGVYEDSLACQLLGQTYYVHPDKTIKITVDLVVTSEVIGAFASATAAAPRAARSASFDASRASPDVPMNASARHGPARAPDAAGVIRKFANAIARKAAEARGETFVPTPYDETAVDAVVVTAVPPVAPASRRARRRRRAMDAKPATLVADGAKKVSFDSKRKDNGYLYLIERFAASRRRTRCASRTLLRLRDDAKSGCPKGKVLARAHVPGTSGGIGLITFGLYDSKVEVAPPRPRSLERYKADFALQLKDLAHVEAADEAYLRDQAAALAPPEPMPDGSRPPIDAHSRRVARAGLANTLERMIERRRSALSAERPRRDAASRFWP
ncbi:hypothetical protein JL720_1006 [Aureococcus anophagefferens]|nr:hypothetical protein JL720_1006 [Aureococcus anophagefferens]